jgi:putative transposase
VILPEVWLYGLMEDYEMPKKRHKAEEIVTKLRQVEVLTAHGRSVAEPSRR